jgi:hypothetical protein
MLGIKYIKFDSTTYVVHYKNGKVARQGRGLSFFYYAPNSSIAAVPVGTNDAQFIFTEPTLDFQTVTIQGQIIFKVEEPARLAELLDFNVNAKGEYKKRDFEKPAQRLVGEAQTQTASFVQSMTLKNALCSSKAIEERIIEGLKDSRAVVMMGVVPLGVNVLAIKATPEMERALEAETREALQQEADLAIYERRNFAVEQERRIRESEMNTEISVEEKKKQIAEKKMETEVLEEQNRRRIRQMKVEADVAVEKLREELIAVRAENERKDADVKGYVLEATLKPYKGMDWKTLMAIGGSAMDPALNIALAFRELAENADKIGNLNITPELLETLLKNHEHGKPPAEISQSRESREQKKK